MAIYKTARLQVKPEGVEKVKQVIREFIAYVRAIEPATFSYLAWQERDDPTRFLHHFVFQDSAAEDRHSNSEAVKKFTSGLYPECITPVEFVEYPLIAQK